MVCKKCSGSLKLISLDLPYRTLEGFYKIVLVHFVAFAVLKILHNLVSVKSSFANNCQYKQNSGDCLLLP